MSDTNDKKDPPKEPTPQERYDALSGNEKMNHALRNSGSNRGTGDVNADIRSAAGREVQS